MASSQKSELPRSARIYIGLVILGGATVAAVASREALHWRRADVFTLLALVAVGAAVEQFLLPFQHRTERQFFSLTDALWMSGLLLARPGVLVLGAGAGILLGQAIRRLPSYKTLFNVGQYLISIAAAEAAYHAFRPTTAAHPRDWLFALLAMLVYFVVNASAVALVISLVTGKPFHTVVGGPLGLNILQWCGNMAVGVLGAVLWLDNRLAVPFLLVPLSVAYMAYRGWLAGVADQERMRGLYEAGQTLVTPLAGSSDFRDFLEAVQRMLDATAAELVLVEGEQVTIHDTRSSVALTRRVTSGSEASPEPEAYVRARPGLAMHVAGVGEPGKEAAGVLAVYRPTALTSAERSVLDALASQVTTRLENFRLFAQTVEARTQLEEILAHTSDGIFTVSCEGAIQSWNPAMRRITRFSDQEAIGRQWSEVLTGGLHDEGQGTPWPPRSPQGSPVVRDIQVVRQDRIARWVRSTWNPMFEPDGTVKGHVVVARDVTAELEAEQLKADFVATVSHELRTPLTPLKGFVSALLQGTVEDSPEARQEYYRIMLNQANRLERLITDLLEASRIESGNSLVDAQPMELAGIVAERVHEFREQEPARRIVFSAPGGPVVVRGDPFRVGQVISNLVSNALKYSPRESSVEVSVARTARQAVVSVRDHGDGIPESEYVRVFERFQRLETGLTRQTSGAGLGLYIAKRLVEAMSGTLWLESGPGGSTFSFSLPFDQLVPAADRGERPPPAEAHVQGDHGPDGSSAISGSNGRGRTHGRVPTTMSWPPEAKSA